MIEWITKSKFWEIFQSEYKPYNRYLNEVGYFECTLDKLKKIAKTEPVDTPKDESDFPGPVLRWYVRINGHLALITHHYQHDSPFVDVEFEDDDQDLVREVIREELQNLGFKVQAT